MAKFNSNVIGAFFVKHVEKMIFVIAVVCLGGLAYQGFKTKRFTKTTPKKLKESAEAANRYMLADSWDSKIGKFRKAESNTRERIVKSPPLRHDKYTYGQFMATRLRTLGLRSDPELKPVQEMLAQVITAPIVIKQAHTKLIDFVSLDAGFEEEESKKSEDDGFDNIGGGGVGGEFKKEEKKKKENTGPSRLQPSLALERPLNPTSQLWRASKARPDIRECICVTGLVPFESQWKEFDAKLRDAKGWYPGRDRPNYIHLEIQRRIDGGEWVDITADLDNFAKNAYANYQPHLTPEFVDRKYLHPTLSHQTPPFLDTEYRKISTHPKVAIRQVIDYSLEEGSDEETVVSDIDDPFANNKSGDGEKADKKKKGGDSEQHDHRAAGGQTLAKLGGSGADSQAMLKELAAERFRDAPSSSYKLVRFFDPRVVPGKTYEYRVRVWVSDPNNPGSDDAAEGGKGANAPQSGDQMSAPSSGGGAEGAGAGIGGDFEREETGTKDDKTEPGTLSVRFVALKGSDLDPKVRERIIDWENELRDKPDLLPEVPGKPKAFLRNARPTPWSEPTPPIKVVKSPAKFVAGGAVRRGFESLIDKTSGKTYQYFNGAPFASLVVSKFDRDLDIELPGIKNVYAGDILNFKADCRFLNPLEWTIHNRSSQEFKSDAVVVGVTGGERVSFTMAREENNRVVYSKEKPKYAAPSEILLMDVNGKFILRNEIDDKMAYRQSTFTSDEKLDGKPVGRSKDDDKKDEEKKNRGGRNGRRGGGNGDF